MEVVPVAAALIIGLAVGVLIAVVVAARGDRRRTSHAPAPVPPVAATALSRRVLEVMRSAAVVVDSSGGVVLANPAARQMGVVRGGRVVVDELRRLAREAGRDGVPRHAVVDTPRGRLGREPIAVSVHVAPLVDTGDVALLLEDVTEARRLEAVRRDFVANVSHELKTPVGALTLLAEAVQDAADDPEAIRRFAERMQREGSRLGRLVAELIELSRLQGADPLPAPAIVDVDDVVAEAVDRTRLAAESAGISVVAGGQRRLTVRGSETQLVTALVNLVDNAVAYSPAGTRVALGIRRREGYVEVSVSDQGIGIAERDLERVFERFYRADPARSRATGGTGLGLAIVKHIATNHGGGVSVWSVEGSGSTFTLRLPLAAPDSGDGDGEAVDLEPAAGTRPQRTGLRAGEGSRTAVGASDGSAGARAPRTGVGGGEGSRTAVGASDGSAGARAPRTGV
ncbi:MAG TPA: ATP-binding protein, partial [Mycobacteriales bacterium]|nr:ATP-binding protein [Mycobacteriales bacterium]